MACQRKSPREVSANAALSIEKTQGMWSTIFDDDCSGYDGVDSPFGIACVPSEPERSIFKPVASYQPKNFIRAQFSSCRSNFEKRGRFDEPCRTGAIKRRTYLRRTTVHTCSTEKLFLSRRMSRIIKSSSLKLSPIKTTNLAQEFKHAQVSRVIRDTRAGIVISPK